MVQKGYFQITIPIEYKAIIETIQKDKPELKSQSKVVELSLQLLYNQVKGDIIRFEKKDIDEFKKIMLRKALSLTFEEPQLPRDQPK